MTTTPSQPTIAEIVEDVQALAERLDHTLARRLQQIESLERDVTHLQDEVRDIRADMRTIRDPRP